MNNPHQQTDGSLMKLIGERLAAVRLSKNLTQQQVAEQAGVGLRTVQRLELGATATQLSGFVRVCRVLGLMDRIDAFIPAPTVSPMAQLKLHRRQRRRATGLKSAPTARKPWTWAEPTSS